MSRLETVLNELVIGNRILSHENIADAYGHISVRNPENPKRFFMSRSLSPELVERADIMEFDLDGAVVGNDRRSPYLERFIHAGIFQARPEVHSVVHAHAEDILPFGISRDVTLRPVIHSGSFIGKHVPIWDIADKFGDTDLLVRNIEQGRDLAASLGNNNVALMRGHGFAAAAQSVIEAVRLSVYLPRNARVQLAAMQLGKFKPLSEGEMTARDAGTYKPYSGSTWRAWEYWAYRAGCSHMIGERPENG
jgi:ribulose-5-phosphate 4-epimerase/fuculose-1-phosphate aldolase